MAAEGQTVAGGTVAGEASDEGAPDTISPEDIDATFVPVPIEDVEGISIDGEGVVLVKEKGSIHWMNQISTVIWESLDGVSNIEQIATELSKTFHADRETVLNDVTEAVRRFGGAFLLEGVVPRMAFGGAAPANKLEIGAEISPFELPDLDGQIITMEILRGEKVLLVNWSPTCGFCKKIVPDFAEMETDLRDRGVRPVFITSGSPEANRAVFDEAGLEATLLFQGDERVEVFAGMGTPAAYLVDEDGMVASELAMGADEVPRLLAAAAGLTDRDESNVQVSFVRRV